jgi:hypothetical protein
MFMIPTGNGFSIAEFHQSELVDFPVWLLHQCGIKIPPFSGHGVGFERLRTLEIDAASWNKWFQMLILCQHTGFRLQRDGVTALVDQWKNALNTVPFSYDGMAIFEASLEDESPSVLDRYYELIVELSEEQSLGSLDLQPVDNPVALWQGAESARAELLMLWKRYSSRPGYRVHHAADLNRRLVRDSHLCEKINGTLKEMLGEKDRFLMVNFINYPHDIFTIAGPCIIIGLNVDKPFSADVFMDLLTQSVAAITN